MYNKTLVVTCLNVLLLWGCQPNDDIAERTILAKVQQDTPYLAHMEATYSLAFTNYHKRPFVSDDFYIRKDQAKVFYGYSLKDAEIELVNENNTQTLWVRLPNPKQISKDRKTLSIESVRDNFHPIDQDKNKIDVEAWMDQNLNGAIADYEEKTIDMTREVSRQYFEALAYRFGVKLKLEFIE